MINIYDKYANIKHEATKPKETAHGLPSTAIEEMAARFDKFLPSIAHTAGPTDRLRSIFDDALPPGATWSATKTGQTLPGTGISLPGGGRTLVTQQTPYQPEFGSPDRQQYPVHRILANRYWRLFYKLDPVIGNCVELYSELPWSNFELTGDGVEGEIRHQYEQMCRETQILALLPYFVKEFLVVGEAIPHSFFDDEKGIFTHVSMHNPDQLEVIDAPFIKMDPIMEFIPDDRLRSILTSEQPSLRSIRDRMPPELITRLTTRQNIPLSPINTTFIPRKLHPYDTRGTSILSRLWRVLMLEDAIFNACYTGETLVSMADGTVQPICEIKIGDKVLDKTGHIQTVIDNWKEDPPNTLCVIKAQGTPELRSTTHHKYPVFTMPRTCLCGCGSPVKSGESFIPTHPLTDKVGSTAVDWIGYDGGTERWNIRLPKGYQPVKKLEAHEIRAGDYLMVPREFDDQPTSDTLEYARLLGYYLAEGSNRTINKVGYGIQWSLCDDEINTLAEDIKICCAKLGHHTTTTTDQKKHSCTVSMHQVSSIEFADKFRTDGGSLAHKKKLSAKIMSWPLSHKTELIKGYFLGDGHGRKQGHVLSIKATSVSEQLINQLRTILAQLGIFASYSKISYATQKQPDGVCRKDQFALNIQGPSLDVLWQIVYGEAPPRNRTTKTPSAVWMDENYVYIPVKSVEIVSNTNNEPVFNLTVSGDHSYLVHQLGTFNTIQTARRHAGPLKVAKLGNAATGWIPPPEQEKRLLELLAQAEQDPNAWLVYHYGLQFETIGTTDRVMSVNREWDVIERIKLVALGISKSFLHGEVSYASSATGLQVFLQRLKSLRLFFEQKWLYPKFFRPIAEINGWIKPKSNELVHRYRIKRSAQELRETNRYILPKIVWDKSLDPQINTALITAMQALETMGIKFSKTSKMATVGYSFEEETKKLHREIEFEKTFLPKLQTQDKPESGGAGGIGGMPPMGDMPPPEEGRAPPGTGEEGLPPGVNAPPAPPGAAKVEAEEGKSAKDFNSNNTNNKQTKSTNTNLKSEIWTDDTYGNWKANEVSDLLDLLNTLDTDNAFWAQLGLQKEFKQAIIARDMNLMWNLLDDYLQQQSYPDKDIQELQFILESEKVLVSPESVDMLKRLEDALPEDSGSLSDDDFVAAVQRAIVARGPLNTSGDTFLSGNDNASSNPDLIGDLSDFVGRK